MIQQYTLFGCANQASTNNNNNNNNAGLLMISPNTTASNSSSSCSSLFPSSQSSTSLLGAEHLSSVQSLLLQHRQQQQQLMQHVPSTGGATGSGADRKKLFVGNLPTNTRLPELVKVFEQYGRVNQQLSVVKDDNYAFIHFYNENDAQLALNELNGSLFNKKYIRVQYSNSNGHIKQKSNCFLI